MSRISLLWARALLLIAVTVLCIAEKNWPDLTCHPQNNDPFEVSSGPSFQKHMWNKCLQKEMETGVCAKLCVLNAYTPRQESHGEDGPNDPVNPLLLNVDHYVSVFSDMLGYNETSVDQSLKKKVSTQMERCKPKFPNMNPQLNINSCKPWKEALDCIDKAWGCPGQ